VTLTQSFSPYGEQLSRTGTGASSFGFTGEWADSSVKLLFLRSRYYSDDMGRFLTRDTWQGDYTQPLTLNGWNYVNSNPVNFTDPSGHCIFTGVDTVACIVALAVGIPVVAGVTTASWDYFVTQGGGYGGFNQYQQDCIDISQVLDAGKGGTLGALSSEGFTIASIPLGPTYLFAYLVHHETPTEVNMNILSAFGLADEYQNALGNPYFFAGQSGGNAGMTYISLASFLKGLPNLVNLSSRTFSNPITQPGGLLANKMILTLPGIEVVGGSGELVYIGTAGMAQQLSMFARGNNWPQAQAGEAQIRKIIESEPDWELLGEQVDIEVITKNGARTRRVDFLVRNKPDNSIFAVEVKTGPNAVLRPRQESLDAIMEQQGGTIISHKVPPAYFGRYVYKIGTIVINLY
jgi:RHS repeat-associated protein